MAFEILATIIGEVADQAEAERLAQEIAALVARAPALGCIVDIRDTRLGRQVERIIRTSDDPRWR